jgi:hypothetical protein
MKTVTRGLPLAALAMALSACAQSPDSIKPANIDSRQFAYLSCPQLAQYKLTLTAAYNNAASGQENAQVEDAASMLTLGIPIGSATHKWTAWQVSDLKGRIAAVQKVQTADNCAQREAAVYK